MRNDLLHATTLKIMMGQILLVIGGVSFGALALETTKRYRQNDPHCLHVGVGACFSFLLLMSGVFLLTHETYRIARRSKMTRLFPTITPALTETQSLLSAGNIPVAQRAATMPQPILSKQSGCTYQNSPPSATSINYFSS